MNLEKRMLLISCLGAHSNSGGSGFRQKDVRFLLELFTNWMDVMLKPDIPTWHNTQIMRFLDSLVVQGWARVNMRAGKKAYHLTRLGLLDLIDQLTDIKGYAEFRHTLLVHYFLVAYEKRMVNLISRDKSGFSKAVQLEISQLLDHKRFLKLRIGELDLQIDRMKLRVRENKGSIDLAAKLAQQGETHKVIVEAVAKEFPYELEGQKPMSELLSEIAPEQQLWEICEGNAYRGQFLFEAQLDELVAHRKILERLLEKSESYFTYFG